MADFWVAGVAGRLFWRVVLERFLRMLLGEISVDGVGNMEGGRIFPPFDEINFYFLIGALMAVSWKMAIFAKGNC